MLGRTSTLHGTAIYAYTDPPGTTPTDRHIWQSHGVSGIGLCFGDLGMRQDLEIEDVTSQVRQRSGVLVLI